RTRSDGSACRSSGTGGLGCGNRAWSTPWFRLSAVRGEGVRLMLGIKLSRSHIWLNEQAPVIDDDTGGLCGTQPLVPLPLLVPALGVGEGLPLPHQAPNALL